MIKKKRLPTSQTQGKLVAFLLLPSLKPGDNLLLKINCNQKKGI